MNTETTILQVLLYSGILLYLGYTMGKQNHREIIRKTIDGLANSGFLKWYWKDGEKEFVKWRDPYPEDMKIENEND
jgi:hypothetical protein|tara:strand:+ start:6269 stop:6496 length:228 start_codon:yes stop_codon:yes gene_type:complete